LHLAAQAASKGREVVLKVADELTLGMTVLQLIKTMEEDVKRGVTSREQYRENVNRIRPTIAWKNFEQVDFVLDAAPGNGDSKRTLLRDLEQQVSPEAAIALLQPWLDLAEFQAGMLHPERLVGMHWPAPVGRA